MLTSKGVVVVVVVVGGGVYTGMTWYDREHVYQHQ